VSQISNKSLEQDKINGVGTRRLGPFRVHPIGFGCMNFCHAYGPSLQEEDVKSLLHTALDLGVNHFDTAALYGFGVSETLVGKYLASHRKDFVLASKCGLRGVESKDTGKKIRVLDGRPETIKATCEDALRRLRTEVIDLYYLHRWDRRVPIEESVGALADLLREGKIRSIGLSEVSAETLRRAYVESPIAAVQTEYSLWTRNPERGLLQACRELGVSLVAFSPLGRGFITDMPPTYESLGERDLRRMMPRFMPGAIEHNTKILERIRDLSRSTGHPIAQLALAWLLSKGDDVLPIPGTRNPAYLRENMASAGISLDEASLLELDECFRTKQVIGHRYGLAAQMEVDTEDERRLGIIGFGEVGQIFSEGLRSQVASVTVYDLKFEDKNQVSSALRQKAEALDANVASTIESLCKNSDLIISAVTASNTLDVAKKIAEKVLPGSFFLDLNSASPGTKKLAAEAIDSAGGRYIEAGVMTSVPPFGIAVPILLGGSHSKGLQTILNRWGMQTSSVSEQIGIPSATKMSRSIMIKGLEALVIESFVTARHYGVEEEMIETLQETFPGVNWRKQAAYFFMRVAQHGRRRSEEMVEAAQTVAETGFHPTMASGIAEKHRWVADIASRGIFINLKKDAEWFAWADAMIAHRTNTSD
jgi:aryl-alcohol dehydrogenase-like predicted oxidoreductase/3-hydroxyisobutyrate dehydrogenase-like beta-hydroxyacid dehydrogenase